MSEIWKPHAPEVYKSWVEAIEEEASEKLSQWETKFVADISYKLQRGWQLSRAQADKLEAIYTEYTS